MKSPSLSAAAFAFTFLYPILAQAQAWQVEPADSHLTFEVSEGGRQLAGEFETFTADIRFDPDDLANAAIDVSIDTASAATGTPDKDSTLPGSDWFYISKFPAARFTSTNVKHLGGNDYVASGTLTIRDQTHPADLNFVLNIEGDRAHAVGSTTIDRLDYGVGASVTNEATLAHQVTVKVDLTATRAP